ncbi:MAG: riboflavin synthase [Candidatus Methylomirabilales bacterium]
MFTGIVEAVGRVRAMARAGAGARIAIAAPGILASLRVGESLAVDGVCLTVTAREADAVRADVSAETLARTTLGRRRPGDAVNLERPVQAGQPLGGHLVTGHVDAVGTIASRRGHGQEEIVRIRFPRALAPLLVLKGSIAVDGISLTVAELAPDAFGVALIPHTARATTLGRKRVGDLVNLEADLIAKHLARLEAPAAGTGGLTLERLKEYGYA